MQFYFKRLIFICYFTFTIKFLAAYSKRIYKLQFVQYLNLANPNFALYSEPSLMPRPSRERKSESSKSTKIDHERLKETLKSLRDEPEKASATSKKEEREAEVNSWRVVLYNDDIHNFTYVTESIAKCIPQFSLARSHLITLEAHRFGQADVLRTWKDKAEQYCRELQKYGLTVCTINDPRNSDKPNSGLPRDH